MASHVVVIDTTFRRANIKVNPGTYLSDILEEACRKLNLKASNYGFKNNNKPVDMSRTFRQSGLSSGAKLELVIASRSPSAVSIALQLPETEAKAAPGGRLLDKFASNTTLWLLLRAFESKDGTNYNFTGRGVAKTDTGATGAGRIVYETPVLNIMGRELSSFTELQKTLAQLGLNSGSSLIRLSFRQTETPLEEAMAEIGAYFKATEGSAESGVHATPIATLGAPPSIENASLAEAATEESKLDTPTAMDVDPLPAGEAENTVSAANLQSLTKGTVVGPDQRPITVFSAPSGESPKAALQQFNDDDYEPTVVHAKLHQALLQSRTQNIRLPSDAEAEIIAKEKAERQAAVKEVSIKVRFPDQLSVVSVFNNIDTGNTLYEFVRGVIVAENEPFSLVYTSMKGPQTVPKEDKVKLIADLGFGGRMLVNFNWDDAASSDVRSKTTLKQQFASKAQEIKVQEIAANDSQKTEEPKAVAPEKPNEGGGKSKGGVPKWLKLPGKK